MLASTATSIMIATSPKRVSMSSRQTLAPVIFASVVARFVEIVVLPMPPLAPKTVITVPRAADLGRRAVGAEALALFLLQDAVDGAAQVFRLQRLDEVVARAGHHRPPHRLRVGQRRVDDRRRVRHRVGERLDGLQRERDRLFDRDEEDVRRASPSPPSPPRRRSRTRRPP